MIQRRIVGWLGLYEERLRWPRRFKCQIHACCQRRAHNLHNMCFLCSQVVMQLGVKDDESSHQSSYQRAHDEPPQNLARLSFGWRGSLTHCHWKQQKPNYNLPLVIFLPLEDDASRGHLRTDGRERCWRAEWSIFFLLEPMSKYANNRFYFQANIQGKSNHDETFILKLRGCVAVAIGRGSAKYKPPFVMRPPLAIAEDRSSRHPW